jgi:hypothetical protein
VIPACRRGADLWAMRRLFALLALAALTVAAAGCSGRDAQEAQALLAQSDAALAKVRSASFTAKLWIEGGPQEFSLTMAGGAYSKGKQAGDFYVVVGSSETFFEDVVVIQRNGKASASVGGTLMTGAFPPMPAEQSIGMVKFDPYVKDVEVESGKLLAGEAVTKVTGVLDTDAFLDGSLGAIHELAGLGDAGFDVGDAFGDIRAVFYISDVTRLPVRALVDLPMDVLGEEVVLHMDFAYTSFDERLSFPSLR